MSEEMNVTEETTENNEMMEVENDDFAGYEDDNSGICRAFCLFFILIDQI